VQFAGLSGQRRGAAGQSFGLSDGHIVLLDQRLPDLLGVHVRAGMQGILRQPVHVGLGTRMPPSDDGRADQVIMIRATTLIVRLEPRRFRLQRLVIQVVDQGPHR
jgi:hypothetical protein